MHMPKSKELKLGVDNLVAALPSRRLANGHLRLLIEAAD